MSQHLDTLNAQCHLQGLNILFLHLMRALHFCIIMISLTNRFQVAVRLFSNRSQMTSKCGKNKKEAHKAQPSVSLMFLPHFDVHCDLLLNRRTATWNLFVLYDKEFKKSSNDDVICTSVLQVRTNQNACITELII